MRFKLPTTTSNSGANRLKSLPKVLLHDHLDGGLRPETIIEIADEIGYTNLPTNKPTELADWYQEACDSGSLVRYLETFDHTIAVMQREQDMIRVAKEAVIDLANDGVIYAEIRVAPEHFTKQEILEFARPVRDRHSG